MSVRIKYLLSRAAILVCAYVFMAFVHNPHMKAASKDLITDPKVLDILDRVTLAWPEHSVAFFQVDVSDDKGNDLGEGEVQLSHDTRVFEYLKPSRYNGDFLYMDGERLHLDQKSGRESVRPVVHRDLKDRLFFWLAVVAFHDVEETHVVSAFETDDQQRSNLTLDEVEGQIRFDRIVITAEKDKTAPIKLRFHDVEEDEYWDLVYQMGNMVTVGDKTISFPSSIEVYPEREGEHYLLKVSQIKIGTPSHEHRGMHHGFE